MERITKLLALLLLFVPFLVHAQGTTINSLLSAIITVVGWLIPVVVSFGILVFLWGLAKYILKQDDVEEKAAARSLMIWGVIAIFIMVSLWGFVNLLQQIVFGSATGGQTAPTWPQISGGGGSGPPAPGPGGSPGGNPSPGGCGGVPCVPPP